MLFRSPQLRQLLSDCQSAFLRQVFERIDPLEDLCAFLEGAIVEEPPALLKDGGVIRPGFNSELDQLRELVQNTKQVLVGVESSERERSGIKTLKIGYNRVFGYYIEVSKKV